MFVSSLDGRTIVLLGAGASADAGLPLTSALAAAIVQKANDTVDARGLPPGPPDWVRALNAVYAGMVGHQGLRGGNPLTAVNVETLISAVRLLQNRDSHEVAPFVAAWSPALSNFDSGEIPPQPGDKIADVISRGLMGHGGMIGRDISEAVATIARAALRPDLQKPFADAEIFILRSLVELLDDIGDVSYFQPLVDLARSQSGGLDVITLNYDLTVETIAARNGVRVVRGIEAWQPGQPLVFPYEDGVLNLMKLHGSLDWRRAAGERKLPSELTPPRLDIVEPQAMVDGDRRSQLSWIVVGDREKLATDGPTLALNFAARDALTRATHLAVVGYSFSDGHINAMIRDWLAADDARTISVLDLRWPRERYYREARDFKSVLLATYGRDHDWENHRLLPRMIPVEGRTKDQLSAVLAARPHLPPEHLVTAHATRTEDHIQIDLTWHGIELSDVTVEAHTPTVLGRPPRPDGRIRLHRSLPLDSPLEEFFGTVHADVFPVESSMIVYADATAALPLELTVSGASILGGRSVSVLVE